MNNKRKVTFNKEIIHIYNKTNKYIIKVAEMCLKTNHITICDFDVNKLYNIKLVSNNNIQPTISYLQNYTSI